MAGCHLLRCVWAVAALSLGLATAEGRAGSPAVQGVGQGDMRPMVFSVVRSSRPGCEPTCPEWIYGEGEINADTPLKLNKVLKSLGARKLPVVLNSPGGDVEAALAMGRAIRAAKLDAAVGGTVFMGCDPRDPKCVPDKSKGGGYRGTPYTMGAMCNSACPLMLAGGVRRLSGAWAHLGVHQITTRFVKTQVQYRTTYRIENGRKKILGKKIVGRKNVGSYTTVEMGPLTEKKLRRYLEEMGVEATVVDAMISTPASEIRRLGTDEASAMKLITSKDPVEFVTSPDICKVVPAANNCRVLLASDTE